MFRIEQKHVEPVEGWDADLFARWLLTETTQCIKDIKENTSRYAFRPLHYLFLPSVPAWDTLRQIHDALGPRSQESFRTGLARAISNLRSVDSNYAVLEYFCFLARGIKCIEASEALVRQVGYEGFGAHVSTTAADAFALVLTTLAGMTTARKALCSLEALSSSPWFRAEYAPTTLVCLARGDWDLLRHLDRLRFAFDKLDRSTPRLGRMYAELVAVVPLSELARCLPSIILEHQWLGADLVRENGLLHIEENGPDVWLARRDDPARRERMQIPMNIEYPFFCALATIIDTEYRERMRLQVPGLFENLGYAE